MITEDYVSFETAKLLKENGFEGENRDWYNMEGFIEEIGVDDGIDPTAHEDIFNYVIPAPTHQMAMKWLREMHNFYVDTCPCVEEEYWNNKWNVYVSKLTNKYPFQQFIGVFNTYEEACEESIKYCLKNLI